MDRRNWLRLGLSSALALVLPPWLWAAEPQQRLSGPVTHGNLAVYFLHGASAEGPVPATLQEAVASGNVIVHETGDVNELLIENRSERAVFVQSGDLVKGGKQDRALMVSLIIPPRSGRLPIAAFCVEEGRWSARGGEDVSRFQRADRALPSRKAKIAIRAPAAPIRSAPGRAGRLAAVGSDTGLRQREVWRSVADTQMRLAGTVGQSVAATQSRSSLQLTLEHRALDEVKRGYVEALASAGRSADDIVGFIFAINGSINSGDIYPSNALFRKMWPKLIDAGITEAIAERREGASSVPPVAEVEAFLAAAGSGAPTAREVPAGGHWETREGPATLFFEARAADGSWVHRSFLAK